MKGAIISGLYLAESVMANFFEIVELSNGDVALRKADDDSADPIVTIQFSEDAKTGLRSHHIEVAKAMLEAGVHKVSEISGVEIEHADMPDDYARSHQIH